MENELSNRNVVKMNNDNNIFYFNNKDKVDLKVCFYQCDYDFNIKKTKTNNQYLPQNTKSNITPLYLKSQLIKRNSFSQQYTNPIKKEYSFDYYNNNTDIYSKISKDSIDKKIYLCSKSDCNIDTKVEYLISKESLVSNQDWSKKINKNKKQFKNIYNNQSNDDEYILYKNDKKNCNKYINAFDEIKHKKKQMPRCSSLKNYVNHNKTNFINNKIKNSKNILQNKNINNKKCNNNSINNKKGKIRKDINNNDNNNNKKKKKLKLDYKNNINRNILNDIDNYNSKSQIKKIKYVLSNNYLDDNIYNFCITKKNNLIYSNSSKELYSTKHTSFNCHCGSSKKNNIEQCKLNDKVDNCIRDYNNMDNNKNKEIIKNNKDNENDTNSNPLGHIVDNFVFMLKYKNNNEKSKKNLFIKKKNKNNNNYNDSIMKKKQILDNMCISKAKSKTKNDYYQYKYKDYSNIENKLKKIDINNKKKMKEKNGIKAKKEEYEKIYGKNNHLKRGNNSNYFKEKLIDNKVKLNKNNISLINDNKNITKINKYNEAKIPPKININANIFSFKENENKIHINTESKTNLHEKYNYFNYDNENNLNSNTKNIKKGFSNIYMNENNKENSKLNNSDYLFTQNNNNNNNNFEIKQFDIFIQNKDNKENNIKKINEDNKNLINEYKPKNTPIFNRNIEIQNLSNLSYYSNPKIYFNTFSKQNIDKPQILFQSDSEEKAKRINKSIESVKERVRKLINQKGKINNKNISLSTKLNIDTNLTISEENDSQDDTFNIIQRNIKISSKTIFTIYSNYEKPIILAFDYENKMFSIQDYSDFSNFEENYKLSINNNENNNRNKNNFGNLYLTIDTNFYIITGKNHDMLFMFDSIKKTINKLCNLKNNHSNGNLLYYENNIICLSGDYNKKVEIFQINKNEWRDLPEMITERSNSASCIINKKENKYIFNLFGYNYPTKEYLNTIEFLNINQNNSNWKYLNYNYNNPNLISLHLSNFFCINYNDNKIIIIGGYNGKDNKSNDKYIQINLDDENIKENILVEDSGRKLKDIDINTIYYLCNGYKINYIKDKKEILYEIFDSEFNCHLFQKSNMVHDIFYYSN